MHKSKYIMTFSTPSSNEDMHDIEIEATSRQDASEQLREISPAAYIHRIQKRIGECAVSSAD